MTKKTDIQKEYLRGYWAGLRHKWPEHRPPMPPKQIVAEALQAAIGVRDALDWLLATFEENGDEEMKFGKYIDTFDESVSKISEWLKEPDYEPKGG